MLYCETFWYWSYTQIFCWKILMLSTSFSQQQNNFHHSQPVWPQPSFSGEIFTFCRAGLASLIRTMKLYYKADRSANHQIIFGQSGIYCQHPAPGFGQDWSTYWGGTRYNMSCCKRKAIQGQDMICDKGVLKNAVVLFCPSKKTPPSCIQSSSWSYCKSNS